jgi:probable HAF family extracellular repeat protein
LLSLLWLSSAPSGQHTAPATWYELHLLPHQVSGESVNTRGIVVARGVSGAISYRWSRPTGLQQLFPAAGLPYASVADVNRAGFAVGYSHDYSQATVPTVWSPSGVPAVIPGTNGSAGAISDTGVVIGVDFVGTTRVPWIWDASSGMRPLADFGLPSGYDPTDICSSFVVGGGPNLQAFRLDLSTSTFTPLGALGFYSNAASVNQHGHVVGWTNWGGFYDIAPFLWTPEHGMRRLGPLMPDWMFLNTGWAWSINDSGEVVGEIEVATDFYHAFLWNEFQGMRDLNELVKNRGPYELTRARSISSSGWITGLAIDHSNGDTLIGFVLKPI